MNKILGTLLIVVSSLIGIILIIVAMGAHNRYQNDIVGNWELADKASTITQKSDYIDKFVDALDRAGLQGMNNALIYKNIDNSFDKNFEALKSLQTRLHTIKTMDENSFAYQTAIQQITAQEQGEADKMLNVFHGCWYKLNYYYFWNAWIVLLIILGIPSLFIFGIAMLFDN